MSIQYTPSELIRKTGIYELPTFFRNVKVLLAFLNNASTKEIATELNLNRNTLRARADTAARRLWCCFFNRRRRTNTNRKRLLGWLFISFKRR
jgi:hypothetical protein